MCRKCRLPKHYHSHTRMVSLFTCFTSKHHARMSHGRIGWDKCKSFSVFGPTAWNSLPLSLRKTLCFTTFKTKLKIHRTLRSLDASLLTVPRFCLETFGRRSFSVFGPTVWNSLPLSLRKKTFNFQPSKRR